MTPRAADNPNVAFDAVIPFPLAATTLGLGLRLTSRGLAGIDYVKRPEFKAATTPQAKRVVRQLEAYFKNGRRQFDIQLDLDGTAFQKRVWSALRRIPTGQTRTYGELAHQLKSAAQAVGQACKRNPVSLIVPCHRVVASTGMGGYGGQRDGERLRIKQALLTHEGWTYAGR